MNSWIRRAVVMIGAIVACMGVAMPAEACTGVIVGKDLSRDGSVIFGRTEDLEPDHNKQMRVHPAGEHRAGQSLYDSSYDGDEAKKGMTYTFTHDTYKYTSVSDVTPSEGFFDEAGFNEHGVAMDATVSATANKDVLAIDPYVVAGGVTEAMITSIVLPEVATAREGMEMVTDLVRYRGAMEGNTLVIADHKEVWYIEIYTGHQFVALRFPDDKFAVLPNTYFLRGIDVNSADVVASDGIAEVARQAGTLRMDQEGRQDMAASYAPSVMKRSNRSRVWSGIKALNPDAPVSLDSSDFTALNEASSHSISLGDVMAMQRNRFEGTPYRADDGAHDSGQGINLYPIGNINTMEAHIFQLRDSMPVTLPGTMWLAVGSPLASPYVPYYGAITAVPDAVANTSVTFDPDSQYWQAMSATRAMTNDARWIQAGINYVKALEEPWIGQRDAQDREIRAASVDEQERLATTQSAAQQACAFQATQALAEAVTRTRQAASAYTVNVSPAISLHVPGFAFALPIQATASMQSDQDRTRVHIEMTQGQGCARVAASAAHPVTAHIDMGQAVSFVRVLHEGKVLDGVKAAGTVVSFPLEKSGDFVIEASVSSSHAETTHSHEGAVPITHSGVSDAKGRLAHTGVNSWWLVASVGVLLAGGLIVARRSRY